MNVFRVHGPTIRRSTSIYLRCLRSLQKSLATQRNTLTTMGNETKYLLNFLCLKRGAPDGDEGSGGGGGSGGGAIVTANKKRKVTTSMEVD